MFTKSSQYGMRAVLLLATADEGQILGAREMAEKLHVSPSFLSKVLQQLARDELISSIRGPGGGFFMTSANRSKTLYDVIQSVEAKNNLNQCVLGRADCSSENPCPLHFQAVASRDGLFYQLRSYSIEQFVSANQINPFNI